MKACKQHHKFNFFNLNLHCIVLVIHWLIERRITYVNPRVVFITAPSILFPFNHLGLGITKAERPNAKWPNYSKA